MLVKRIVAKFGIKIIPVIWRTRYPAEIEHEASAAIDIEIYHHSAEKYQRLYCANLILSASVAQLCSAMMDEYCEINRFLLSLLATTKTGARD